MPAHRDPTMMHRRVGAAALILSLLAACSTDKLLSVERVGTILPSTVSSSAGADALRFGGVLSLNAFQNTPWLFTDQFTDIWNCSNSSIGNCTFDQRTVPNTDGNASSIWNTMHAARARTTEAIAALKKYKPTPAWGIGQMYWVRGMAEMYLAEYFCNGIPLSSSAGGTIVYGKPMNTQDVLSVAAADLDTALTFLTDAADTAAVSLNYAARTTKGRVLIDQGQFAAAAAIVASVPTSFVYQEQFTLATGDNPIWSSNITTGGQALTVVGDTVGRQSADKTTIYRIGNAIPFASAKDPRVPVVGTTLGTSPAGLANDRATNAVNQQLWSGRSDALPIVSGIDARLVEAEALLQANDLAGLTTKLNALRAAPPRLSASVQPAAGSLPPLAQPTTKDAATTLYFTEKAFWQFGRGQRFGDLRREIRQYGRTQDKLYSVGTYFRTTTPYGTQVVLEIPSGESNNPNVVINGNTYCTDMTP